LSASWSISFSSSAACNGILSDAETGFGHRGTFCVDALHGIGAFPHHPGGDELLQGQAGYIQHTIAAATAQHSRSHRLSPGLRRRSNRNLLYEFDCGDSHNHFFHPPVWREYKFRWNTVLALFLSIGIMVPIRLGSVAIIQIIAELNLINTRMALVLVYTAQNLPLAIFILSEFIQQIPKDLREAGRCDGLSEYHIFFYIILPLLRPAMATVAVFTMIPVWNDLWFPLLLTPTGGKQTITLGVQQFLGQYITDWNAVLAALSTAIVPVLVLYVIFSRQLIRGLTSGAVK
jgi:hypothetical protein